MLYKLCLLPQVDSESLVLDVSGEHSTPSDTPVTNDTGVIRVADVMKRVGVRQAQLRDAPVESTSAAPRTMDVRSDRPLRLYVWREQTARHRPLLNLMPSQRGVASERCSIDAPRHHQHLLYLRQQRAQTSLRFKKHTDKKQLLNIRLTCRAKADVTTKSDVTSKADVTSKPFVIDLTVHIV